MELVREVARTPGRGARDRGASGAWSNSEMSIREASCPGCGNVITFRNAATLFVVCEYCKSSSWRTDVDLQLVGKVANVAEIDTPFALGARGEIGGIPWMIVGLVQLDHGRGPWNEWCLSMGDGSWAWLAEAQGEYIITKELDEDVNAPNYDHLDLGENIRLGDAGLFSVVERGEGIVTTALGEIPVKLQIGGKFRYADLRGAGTRFATMDFGASEVYEIIYIGNIYSLNELGFDSASAPRKDRPRIAAERFACPNCAASIEIRDTTNTVRVGCASCGALLDPRSESIVHLKTAEYIYNLPSLPIGTKGTLFGAEYEVYAYLVRSVKSDGIRYPWNEYLLKRGDGAWRWLVESSGHWSFVEPANPAKIHNNPGGVDYEGRRYRRFNVGSAFLEYVVGELYWEAQVGDRVTTKDYISPPNMVSTERDEKEIVASFGTYMTPEEIAAAFKLKKALAPPIGVGAQQPNPFRDSFKYYLIRSGIFIFIILALSVYFHVRAANHVLYSGSHTAAPSPAPASAAPPAAPVDPAATASDMIFTNEFDIQESSSNVEIALNCPGLNNSWVAVDGSLVNVETGEVHNFSVEAGFWSGVEDGEAWSEGSFSEKIYFGPVPAGKYLLRLDPEAGPAARLVDFTIEARNQVASDFRPLIAILLVLIFPLIAFIRRAAFEGARWQQSDEA